MDRSHGMGRALRRYVCVGLLAVMAPLALTGCFGYFPLTRAVYKFNSEVGGRVGSDRTGTKVVQSIVMWIFVIIPVYGVATFADVVVLNLIEFWTDGPVRIGAVQERDGVRVAIEPSADGQSVALTVSRDGEMLTEQVVVKVNEREFEMRAASGELTGRILKTAEGDIHLTDARGQVVQTLAAEDLAALAL